MGDYKRIIFLVLIMPVVAVVIGGVAIGVLYQTAVDEERARLTETARSQARLMETMARHDQIVHGEEAEAATIAQIKDAHEWYEGFGETGEFTLARRVGDEIVFILRHRHSDLDQPRPVPFDSELAEPMRRALSGLSGTVIGPDYRGETVLAAYEPVAVLNLGIVAKIDLAEIRRPFLIAGGVVFGIAFLVIAAGTVLFFRVGEPMVRRIRESEGRLSQANRMLQLVLDNIPARVFWKDRDLNYLGCNRLFAKDAGFDRPEELIGRDDFAMGWRSEAERYRADDRQVIESLESRLSYEEPQTTPEGEKIWLRTSKIPLRDANGDVIGILGTYEDITERKKAEEALAESEGRYRNLFDNIGLGLTLIDADHRIVMINTAHARMFNKPAHTFVGKKCFEEFEKREMVCSHCPGTVAIETGERSDVETEGVRDDGSRFSVHLHTFPAFDKDGRISGFIEIVEDTTGRKEMEERLRQAQKMEAIGRLTAGVAHDFNNMLMIILGNLHFLEETLEGEDERHRFVYAAIAAAKRSAATTQRLLAFSGKQMLLPMGIDLNELVAGMTDLLYRSLGETVAIETALADGLWQTTVDPGQIEAALLNLALNARDAMPKGGAIGIETANVSLDEGFTSPYGDPVPGDYVMLSVRDTGKGMTVEVQEKAFDPFFTTKGMAEHSGLGLSMVHGFARQSGGHVEIDSGKGEGTTVRLYLPRVQEDTVETGKVSAKGEVPRGRGETVLVVEDEEKVLSLCSAILGGLGYEILAAGDGEAVLALLEDNPRIDLLLTDVILPGGVSGPDLAGKLVQRRPEVKVLYMSGYARDILERDGRIGKETQVLQKPFDKADLADAVRERLDGGEA